MELGEGLLDPFGDGDQMLQPVELCNGINDEALADELTEKEVKNKLGVIEKVVSGTNVTPDGYREILKKTDGSLASKAAQTLPEESDIQAKITVYEKTYVSNALSEADAHLSHPPKTGKRRLALSMRRCNIFPQIKG